MASVPGSVGARRYQSAYAGVSAYVRKSSTAST
jgi:hypothetical protein